MHTGTPWRVSTSTVGPSWSTAARHAAAVSLASAGRITCRPGIARSVARCSTGWWVGPSSPTPTESWLNTNTALAHETSRQADGRAHVVEEDEERPADREHAAVHRHPDACRAHRVLADPVVHLPAAGVVGGLLAALVGQLDAGVAGEVGGAGDEAGEVRHGRGEHLRHRLAGGDLLARPRTPVGASSQPLVPVPCHAASHAARSSASSESSASCQRARVSRQRPPTAAR